jgi:hypothetical protein
MEEAPVTIKHAGSLVGGIIEIDPPIPAKLLFWAVILIWTVLAFRAVRRGKLDKGLGLYFVGSLLAIAVSNYLTLGWRPEYSNHLNDVAMMWGNLTLMALFAAGVLMVLAALTALLSRLIWKPRPAG